MEELISDEKEDEEAMNLSDNRSVRCVVIPASELATVDVAVQCTEAGCMEVFASKSNLAMHLAKKHGTSSALDKRHGTSVFHCPQPGCKYGLGKAAFHRTTLLKQHFLKVHAAKAHGCIKCNRGFSTPAALTYHARSCGRDFHCSCGAIYKSNEALLTHARRKQHKIVKQPPETVLVARTQAQHDVAAPAAVPVHLLAAVALSELSRPITREIAVQTDEHRITKNKLPSRSLGSKSRRCRASTHTQTVAPKSSAETQTSGELLLRKAMLQANIKPASSQHMQTQTTKPASQGKKRKHTQTQTIKLQSKKGKDIMKKSAETQSEFSKLLSLDKSYELQNELKSANLTEIESEICVKQFATSRLIINDVSLPEIWLNQKSTQTSPPIVPCSFSDDTLETLLCDNDCRFQTSETQTDFTAKFLEDCDSNFTLCSHIETQTCDELNKSFEQQMCSEEQSFEALMLHSNMCTQTCDLLDFAHIHTQTWPHD